MGLFSERHDLLRQLNAAQERLESLQDQRNILNERVQNLERETQLLAQREQRLRDALEFVMKNCTAEAPSPWATALEMARGALRETEPKE